MSAPTYRGFVVGTQRGGYVGLKGGKIALRAKTENQLHTLIDQQTRNPMEQSA